MTAGQGNPSPSAASVDLHYVRRPSAAPDAPTVVLLHGITDAGACWESVAERLTPDHEVLLPDLRGHGRTPLPEGPVDHEVQAADVERLLETVGSAALIGHSMGAAVAATVAVRRPDLVRALVLEDPPWRDAGERDSGFSFATWVRDLQALDHAGRVEAGRTSDPQWSEAELENWAVAKEQVDVRFFERMGPEAFTTWRDLVPDISVPTLLVLGDVDRGAIVGARVRHEIEQLRPSIEVLHLDGTGHSIHRDRPTAFIDGVGAFLRRALR